MYTAENESILFLRTGIHNLFGTDLFEISFCMLHCYGCVVMWVIEIKLAIKTEIVCRVSFLRTICFFGVYLIFHPWSIYCSGKDYNSCWCLKSGSAI